jgi:hypothetical protein
VDIGTSNNFTVNTLPLDDFKVEAVGGGDISTQTAWLPFAIRITAQDAGANTVTTFYGTVEISSNGDLSLGGGTTAAFSNGVLAFQSVAFSAGGIYTITATKIGSAEAGVSNIFTVNNPVPTATSISPNIVMYGGASFTMTINGTDFVPTSVVRFNGSDRPTTFVSSTQLTAGIPGSDMTVMGSYPITVFNPTPAGGTSNAQTFTVGVASKLAFGQQPSNTAAGSTISPAVTVQIQDANGNVVTDDNWTRVTVAIGTNPSSGTLSGAVTVYAVNGVATFRGLGIDREGSGYTLTASSIGLTSATSSAFHVTTGLAVKLVFTTSPGLATAGMAFGTQPVVIVQDAGGNVVTSSTASISLAIGTNPSDGALSGVVTVSAVNGVATFRGLGIDREGSGYTLTASSSGLIGATSSAFHVTTGSATIEASTYFAQVAIGKGYTTTFTFLNTGGEATSGTMTLTGDDGAPLVATLAPPDQPGIIASSFVLNIPSGGAQSITASGMSPGEGTKTGWAQVVSTGGSLGGVATYQFVNGNALTTVVGVLSASATNSATVPIDDDLTLGAESHGTAYAVANPGNENINIRLFLMNPDGSISKVIDPPALNPLGPGRHVASFIWQDLNEANLQFNGSVVLSAQEGQRFSVVGLVMNQGLYTAIPTVPPQSGATTWTANLFAQVAVGGGYTTTFTFLNTGAQAAFGNMTLLGDDGIRLNATLALPGQPGAIDSTFQFLIPPGGTQLITASGLSPGEGTKTGWAQVVSYGGSLEGVATFEFMNGNALTTVVGVLSASATDSATFPIDDDLTLGAESRSTAYAVANPGNANINIRPVLINPDGSIARTLTPITLTPGSHIAGFLWQALGDSNMKFRGSVVLIADPGKLFSVVALMMNQGLYTAIPVIPGKAPIIN